MDSATPPLAEALCRPIASSLTGTNPSEPPTTKAAASSSSFSSSSTSSQPSEPTHPDPESYEQTHVHAVYEAIAPHFSSTRHKPWPLVSSFLSSLPPGSVGFDVGCGNGKYLPVNRDVLYLVGSDRSANLVRLARDNDGGTAAAASSVSETSKRVSKCSSDHTENQTQSQEGGDRHHPLPLKNQVLTADVLSLPFRPSSADFAISIALLHHLSTPSRRREAVRSVLDTLRPGGRALLYVWALEQRSSRRGWDEGVAQDQLVPWVTKANTKVPGAAQKTSNKEKKKKTRKGCGAEPGEDTAEASRIDEQPGEEQKPLEERDTTWHRYYHLYKQGELEEDIRQVGGVVLESGYEKDNWWAICSTQ